jgi:hypothetical protein
VTPLYLRGECSGTSGSDASWVLAQAVFVGLLARDGGIQAVRAAQHDRHGDARYAWESPLTAEFGDLLHVHRWTPRQGLIRRGIG